MRLISRAVVFFNLLICLNAVRSHILRETGCPPAEDIQPCTCQPPHNILECTNINNVQRLRIVFDNSEGYTYYQVNISFSSLPYLPHEMFDNTTAKNLILHNVTLTKLFDTDPDAIDTVNKLHIENSQISRRMSWDFLQPLRKLRILEIYYNSIQTLDTPFKRYVTKNLQQLSFYATETRRIKPGVLTKFVNLDKIAFEACQLTELTRDMLPRPFNGRVLYFNDNGITSIPADLFIDMPNLHILGFRNNIISVLPESAFGGNAAKIEYFRFEDNPLKCDCQLRWIIKEKPIVLGGTCAAPKRLYRRELRDLSLNDFYC